MMKWSGSLRPCLSHIPRASLGFFEMLIFPCLGEIQIATKDASERSFPSSTLLTRRDANRTESAFVLSPTPVRLLPSPSWERHKRSTCPPPPETLKHCFDLAVLFWPQGQASEGPLSPGANKLALEMRALENSGGGDCLKKRTASSLPGAARRLDTLAVARRRVPTVSAVLIGLLGRASCRPAQPGWRCVQFPATSISE